MALVRLFALLLIVLAVTVAPPAVAQSTDFSRPTMVSNLPIVGEHDGSRAVSYFYGFDAGPGDILITFDGHAARYSSTATLRVFDANRNSLGDINLMVGTSPSSETKRFKLTKRQRIVLESAFIEDTSMGGMKYSINVSGAISLPKAIPVAVNSDMPMTAPSRPGMGTAAGGGTRLRVDFSDGSHREFDMNTIRRIVVE
jgi:hypothetical protein